MNEDQVWSEIEKVQREMQRHERYSNEYRELLNNLRQLYGILIEIRKQDNSDEELKAKIVSDEQRIANDQANELARRKEARKDRWIGFGMKVAELLVPLGAYGLWFTASKKFEQTDSYTDLTDRNLMNNFKPTKR